MRDQWEYFCFDCPTNSNASALLTQYGNGGWELVSAIVTVIYPNGGSCTTRYCMKRKKLPEAEAVADTP